MEAARYLGSRDVDVIINVADATHLSTSLELTLELLPLNKPMLLALNMMDEAARLGLHIDGEGLSIEFGLPVLPLIASKGRGVKGLFVKALEVGRNGIGTKPSNVLTDDMRHSVARELSQRYAKQGERIDTLRDRLDDVLLHPVWGYAILLFVLFLFFQVVYGIGKLTEPPLLALFTALTDRALSPFQVTISQSSISSDPLLNP